MCVFLFPIFGHTKMRVVAINSGLREAVPCDPACFQMAGRVSPPLPHRGEGFASPPLAANLARVLHVLPSGAGLAPLPVSEPWNDTDRRRLIHSDECILLFCFVLFFS